MPTELGPATLTVNLNADKAIENLTKFGTDAAKIFAGLSSPLKISVDTDTFKTKISTIKSILDEVTKNGNISIAFNITGIDQLQAFGAIRLKDATKEVKEFSKFFVGFKDVNFKINGVKDLVALNSLDLSSALKQLGNLGVIARQFGTYTFTITGQKTLNELALVNLTPAADSIKTFKTALSDLANANMKFDWLPKLNTLAGINLATVVTDLNKLQKDAAKLDTIKIKVSGVSNLLDLSNASKIDFGPVLEKIKQLKTSLGTDSRTKIKIDFEMNKDLERFSKLDIDKATKQLFLLKSVISAAGTFKIDFSAGELGKLANINLDNITKNLPSLVTNLQGMSSVTLKFQITGLKSLENVDFKRIGDGLAALVTPLRDVSSAIPHGGLNVSIRDGSTTPVREVAKEVSDLANRLKVLQNTKLSGPTSNTAFLSELQQINNAAKALSGTYDKTSSSAAVLSEVIKSSNTSLQQQARGSATVDGTMKQLAANLAKVEASFAKGGIDAAVYTGKITNLQKSYEGLSKLSGLTADQQAAIAKQIEMLAGKLGQGVDGQIANLKMRFSELTLALSQGAIQMPAFTAGIDNIHNSYSRLIVSGAAVGPQIQTILNELNKISKIDSNSFGNQFGDITKRVSELKLALQQGGQFSDYTAGIAKVVANLEALKAKTTDTGNLEKINKLLLQLGKEASGSDPALNALKTRLAEIKEQFGNDSKQVEEFIAQLKKAKQAYEDLRANGGLNQSQKAQVSTQIGSINSTIAQTEIEALRGKLANLRAEFSGNQIGVGAFSKKLEDLRSQFTALAAAEGLTAAQLKTVEAAIGSISNQMNSLNTGLKNVLQGFTQVVPQANALLGVFGGMNTQGGMLAGALNAVGVALGGMTNQLKNVIADFAEFEKNMDGASATLLATEGQMQDIGNLARDSGFEKYGVSAADAASGVEQLATSGLALDKIMTGGLDAAVLLKAAGGMDNLTKASELLAGTMNSFGISGDKAIYVVDVLANAAASTNLKIRDFELAIAMGGAAAKKAGFSLEDFTVAMGAARNNMLRASDAGTSFKSFVAGLTPNSKEARMEMEKLGFTAFDMQGNFKPLSQIVAELGDAYNTMTPEMAAASQELLFGSDGFRMAAILVGLHNEKLADGTTAYQQMSKELERQNSGQEMANRRTQNLIGQWDQLKAQVKNLGVAIGENLAPMLSDVVTKLQGMADWATNNIGPGKTLTGVMQGLGEALKYVALMIGVVKFNAFLTAVGSGVGVFAGLIRSVNAFKVAVTMTAAIGGVSQLTAAFRVLSATMATGAAFNPWLGLIAASAAAVYAIYKIKEAGMQVLDVYDQMEKAGKDLEDAVGKQAEGFRAKGGALNELYAKQADNENKLTDLISGKGFSTYQKLTDHIFHYNQTAIDGAIKYREELKRLILEEERRTNSIREQIRVQNAQYKQATEIARYYQQEAKRPTNTSPLNAAWMAIPKDYDPSDRAQQLIKTTGKNDDISRAMISLLDAKKQAEASGDAAAIKSLGEAIDQFRARSAAASRAYADFRTKLGKGGLEKVGAELRGIAKDTTTLNAEYDAGAISVSKYKKGLADLLTQANKAIQGEQRGSADYDAGLQQIAALKSKLKELSDAEKREQKDKDDLAKKQATLTREYQAAERQYELNIKKHQGTEETVNSMITKYDQLAARVKELPAPLQAQYNQFQKNGQGYIETAKRIATVNAEISSLKKAVKDMTLPELQAAKTRVQSRAVNGRLDPGDQQKLKAIAEEEKKELEKDAKVIASQKKTADAIRTATQNKIESFQLLINSGKVSAAEILTFSHNLDGYGKRMAALRKPIRDLNNDLFAQGKSMIQSAKAIDAGNRAIKEKAENLKNLKKWLKDAKLEEVEYKLAAERAAVEAGKGDLDRLALLSKTYDALKKIRDEETAQARAKLQRSETKANASNTVARYEGDVSAADGDLQKLATARQVWEKQIIMDRRAARQADADQEIADAKKQYDDLLLLYKKGTPEYEAVEKEKWATIVAIQSRANGDMAQITTEEQAKTKKAKKDLDDAILKANRDFNATILKNNLDNLQAQTQQLIDGREEDLQAEYLSNEERLAIFDKGADAILASKEQELKDGQKMEENAEKERFEEQKAMLQALGVWNKVAAAAEAAHQSNMTAISNRYVREGNKFTIDQKKARNQILNAIDKEHLKDMKDALDEQMNNARDLGKVERDEIRKTLTARLASLESWGAQYKGEIALVKEALNKLNDIDADKRREATKYGQTDATGDARRATSNADKMGTDPTAFTAQKDAVREVQDTLDDLDALIKKQEEMLANLGANGKAIDQQAATNLTNGLAALRKSRDELAKRQGEIGSIAFDKFLGEANDKAAEAALQLAGINRQLANNATPGSGEDDYRAALSVYDNYWANRLRMAKRRTKEEEAQYLVIQQNAVNASTALLEFDQARDQLADNNKIAELKAEFGKLELVPDSKRDDAYWNEYLRQANDILQKEKLMAIKAAKDKGESTLAITTQYATQGAQILDKVNKGKNTFKAAQFGDTAAQADIDINKKMGTYNNVKQTQEDYTQFWADMLTLGKTKLEALKQQELALAEPGKESEIIGRYKNLGQDLEKQNSNSLSDSLGKLLGFDIQKINDQISDLDARFNKGLESYQSYWTKRTALRIAAIKAEQKKDFDNKPPEQSLESFNAKYTGQINSAVDDMYKGMEAGRKKQLNEEIEANNKLIKEEERKFAAKEISATEFYNKVEALRLSNADKAEERDLIGLVFGTLEYDNVVNEAIGARKDISNDAKKGRAEEDKAAHEARAKILEGQLADNDLLLREGKRTATFANKERLRLTGEMLDEKEKAELASTVLTEQEKQEIYDRYNRLRREAGLAERDTSIEIRDTTRNEQIGKNDNQLGNLELLKRQRLINDQDYYSEKLRLQEENLRLQEQIELDNATKTGANKLDIRQKYENQRLALVLDSLAAERAARNSDATDELDASKSLFRLGFLSKEEYAQIVENSTLTWRQLAQDAEYGSKEYVGYMDAINNATDGFQQEILSVAQENYMAGLINEEDYQKALQASKEYWDGEAEIAGEGTARRAYALKQSADVTSNNAKAILEEGRKAFEAGFITEAQFDATIERVRQMWIKILEEAESGSAQYREAANAINLLDTDKAAGRYERSKNKFEAGLISQDQMDIDTQAYIQSWEVIKSKFAEGTPEYVNAVKQIRDITAELVDSKFTRAINLFGNGTINLEQLKASTDEYIAAQQAIINSDSALSDAKNQAQININNANQKYIDAVMKAAKADFDAGLISEAQYTKALDVQRKALEEKIRVAKEKGGEYKEAQKQLNELNDGEADREFNAASEAFGAGRITQEQFDAAKKIYEDYYNGVAANAEQGSARQVKALDNVRKAQDAAINQTLRWAKAQLDLNPEDPQTQQNYQNALNAYTNYWKGVRAAATDGSERAIEATNKISEAVKNLKKGFLEQLVLDIKINVQQTVSQVGQAISPNAGASQLLGTITDVTAGMAGMLNPLALLAQAIVKLAPVTEVISGLFEVIQPIIDSLKEPLQSFGRIVGVVVTPLMKLIGPILTNIIAVLTPFLQILQPIVEFFSAVFKPALEAVTPILSLLGNAVLALYDALANLVRTVTFGSVDITRKGDLKDPGKNSSGNANDKNLNEDEKNQIKQLDKDLSNGKLSKADYNQKVYEIRFKAIERARLAALQAMRDNKALLVLQYGIDGYEELVKKTGQGFVDQQNELWDEIFPRSIEDKIKSAEQYIGIFEDQLKNAKTPEEAKKAQQQIDYWKGVLKNLQDTNGTPVGSIAALQAQKSALQKEYDLAVTQADRDRIKKQMDAIDEQIKAMQGEIKPPDGSIAALQAKRTDLQKEYDNAKTQADRDRIQKDIDAIDEQIKAMQGSAAKPGSIAWYKNKISELQAKMDKAASDVERIYLGHEISKYQAIVDRLSAQGSFDKDKQDNRLSGGEIKIDGNFNREAVMSLVTTLTLLTNTISDDLIPVLAGSAPSSSKGMDWMTTFSKFDASVLIFDAATRRFDVSVGRMEVVAGRFETAMSGAGSRPNQSWAAPKL